MRARTIAMVALAMGISASAVAQEAVTLSRYRLTVPVPAGQVDAATVDLTKLTERCADADGCELALSVALSSAEDSSLRIYTTAKHTRLFLSSDGSNWATDSSFGADANTIGESILSAVANGNCEFWDVDVFPGSQDNVQGFMLRGFSGTGTGDAPWVCTLTVID